MNTQENNKLIAEFMGLKNHFNNQGVTKVLIDGNEHIQDWECYDAERDILITPIEMKYHTSWDWLMPVVDKIESNDRYDVEILQYGTRITDNQKEIVNNIADISFDKKIEHTHNAVVEFIKQYNK